MENTSWRYSWSLRKSGGSLDEVWRKPQEKCGDAFETDAGDQPEGYFAWVDLGGHLRHLGPDCESELSERGEGEHVGVADDQLCLPQQGSTSEAFGNLVLVHWCIERCAWL